ncbi:MAG TPA: hypothetical protein VK826_16195 [Bacteroidia bacterium]|nr:hypothetical protein [Bacteroidia bacterium]
MPQNKFYLDDAKTQEVIISWRGIWKDISITHNGVAIGGFENFRALKGGNRFHLNDGSALDIHWSQAYGDQGLRIAHNGRALKGSSGDPEAKLKGIFGISIFIGALNFIVGALGQFGVSEMLEDMGANWVMMLVGLIIVGLGYVVMSQKSAGALIGIIIVIAADVILSLYFMMEEGGRPSFAGIGLKVLFIIQFARGFGAIREYHEQKNSTIQ